MTGLRINQQHVVFETFDSEILAVNLDTGTYYSLSGSAAIMWKALVEVSTIDGLSRYFAVSDRDSQTDLTAEISSFVDRLKVENLVVDSALPVPADPLMGQSAKTVFSLPSIEVFTDMQDLLLLDPIHEVDEAGWPLLKPDQNKVSEPSA